jgi:hypothetical protein
LHLPFPQDQSKQPRLADGGWGREAGGTVKVFSLGKKFLSNQCSLPDGMEISCLHYLVPHS